MSIRLQDATAGGYAAGSYDGGPDEPVSSFRDSLDPNVIVKRNHARGLHKDRRDYCPDCQYEIALGDDR